MNATAVWRQGLSFTGKAGSGFEVPLDADPQVGGANDGFRPLELMAVSLAGCTGMDVISILIKKNQEVTAFEVKVYTRQAQEFPKVFTPIVIIYMVTGHAVEEAAVLRASEQSATKYCPALAMLGKAVPMELVYEIFEDEGSRMRRMVEEGKYQS
jgi:putative redox protein